MSLRAIDFAFLDDIGYDILDAGVAGEEVYAWGGWGDYSIWSVHAERIFGIMDTNHPARFDDQLLAGIDAFGLAPNSSLANAVLTGTAAWEGFLMGVDVGQDIVLPVFGDASLQVELSDLGGTARFDNLAVYVENEPAPFRAPSLAYPIRVTDNAFSDTENRVVGAFYGPAHEEMAGTLSDRAPDVNLLASFGGER